jgi:hypothetical protein
MSNKDTIKNITNKILDNLGLNKDSIDISNINLDDIPKENIDLIEKILKPTDKMDKESNEKIILINKLLKTDNELNNFGEQIKTDTVKKNFNGLKENLAKLQILILIKTLKESKSCDDILNNFINILNTKVNTVNNIVQNNIEQKGGGNNNLYNNLYFKKYIKYKTKYLELFMKK